MAVEPNNTDLPDPSPGPTDDGYIAVAEKSIPQDPFCCSGPNKDEMGQPPFPLLNILACPDCILVSIDTRMPPQTPSCTPGPSCVLVPPQMSWAGPCSCILPRWHPLL